MTSGFIQGPLYVCDVCYVIVQKQNPLAVNRAFDGKITQKTGLEV